MKQTAAKLKKQIRKLSFGSWILIISLGIVVIFGTTFVWTIYDASRSTGTIITANRFNLELNPKIETSKVQEITTALEKAEYLVKSSVNLKSGTLRITVQVKSDLTDKDLQTAILAIKDTVNTALPIATYFTSTSDIKMYDLEIHVTNSADAVSTDTFKYHYFILVKNAGMTSWKIQEVSVPVNPELAATLKASLNPVQ